MWRCNDDDDDDVTGREGREMEEDDDDDALAVMRRVARRVWRRRGTWKRSIGLILFDLFCLVWFPLVSRDGHN